MRLQPGSSVTVDRTNHARKPKCQARRCATPRGTPRICAGDGDHIRVALRAMLEIFRFSDAAVLNTESELYELVLNQWSHK